jgi:hypothetical protein
MKSVYSKYRQTFALFVSNSDANESKYSKICLKRNAIVPVPFFFPFSQVSVLQRVVF